MGQDAVRLLDSLCNGAPDVRVIVIGGQTKDSLLVGKELMSIPAVVEHVAGSGRRVVRYSNVAGMRTNDSGTRKELDRLVSNPAGDPLQARISQLRSAVSGSPQGAVQTDEERSCRALAALLRSDGGRTAVVVQEPDINHPAVEAHIKHWLFDPDAIAKGNLLAVVIYDEQGFSRRIGAHGPAYFQVEIGPPSREEIRHYLMVRRAAEPHLFDGFSEDDLAAGLVGYSYVEIDQAVGAVALSEQQLTPHTLNMALAGAPQLPSPDVALNAAEMLKQRVIGQPHAADEVAAPVRIAAAGLFPLRGPLAVFLFLGPTGVGKTQLAKEVGKLVGVRPDAIVQIPMDSFQSKGDAARFTGASPGYVGYGEATVFSSIDDNSVRVVLFDECEKSPPEVLKSLISVIDEGRIVTGNNRTISLSRCIVCFTSNLGQAEAEQQTSEEDRMRVYLEHVRAYFLPEFLGRLTKVIVFNRLSEEELKQIARIKVDETIEAIGKQVGISMRVTDGAREAMLCSIERSGSNGRSAARAADMELRNLVSEYMLRRRDKRLSHLSLDVNSEGSFCVREK